MIAQSPTSGTFCPRCGAVRTGEPPSCPRCQSAAYCPSCGKRVESGACPCAGLPVQPVRSTQVVIHDRASMAPIVHALLLYFALMAAILIGPKLGWKGLTEAQTAVNSEFAGLIAISGVALFAAILNIRHTGRLFLKVGDWKWCAIAPGIAIVTFSLVTCVLFLIHRIAPVPNVDYSNIYVKAGYAWWIPLLLTSLQPAVFEELAFRGVITDRLSRILEPRETLFVTAALFATLHLSYISAAHLLVIGLALGYLRQRSGSLYPCMILHACHNGLVVLCEHFLGV